ncbi:hypothetical protein AJ78_06476 [Emergomyces pasteurianus Ep9510]|uniref:Uncharacterized protein n=1 Tax=Emergomyces pasteurianus Ep9510 TaxID=1447872 RepID=A0A1J9QA25_9EURO|nr:hypothetical protein AJ78_06476 [Emergomyces pasteurianus Ep9510]
MKTSYALTPHYRLGNEILLNANFVCDARIRREPNDEEDEDDVDVAERDLLTIDLREAAAACAASAARISSNRTSAAENICCLSLSESRSSISEEGNEPGAVLFSARYDGLQIFFSAPVASGTFERKRRVDESYERFSLR